MKNIPLAIALNFVCLVVVAVYAAILLDTFNNEYIYQYSPVGILLMSSIIPLSIVSWSLCHNIFLTYKK